MSASFLDRGQMVGYHFDRKALIIALSERMAAKMLADGWAVSYEDEIGHFVTITQGETETNDQQSVAGQGAEHPSGGDPSDGDVTGARSAPNGQKHP